MIDEAAKNDLVVTMWATGSQPERLLSTLAALRSPLLACGDDDLFRFKSERAGRWSFLAEQPETVPADDPVRAGLRYLRSIYERRQSGPVPLYIAGTGESAARLAGRVADGFICTSGKGEELYTSKLLPAVREGATKAGRDPKEIELMIEVKVSYDTDRKRALEDTQQWAALALPGDQKVGVEDPREMERLASALTAIELL